MPDEIKKPEKKGTAVPLKATDKTEKTAATKTAEKGGKTTAGKTATKPAASKNEKTTARTASTARKTSGAGRAKPAAEAKRSTAAAKPGTAKPPQPKNAEAENAAPAADSKTIPPQATSPAATPPAPATASNEAPKAGTEQTSAIKPGDTAKTSSIRPAKPKASPETLRRRREEQARKSRRRNRQLLGLVLAVLIVVGAISIIRSGIQLAGTLMDNTDEKSAYEYRIAPMVWFDLLPFENPNQIDENSLKEVIIFGLIDNMGKEIQHDENGSAIVPVLEVDRYAANLFGPDFTFSTPHAEFTSVTQGIHYQYNDSLKAYIVAGTGIELMYAPTVVDVKHESGGVVRVIVGYVSTKTKEGNLLPTLDYKHPVRYMDYMFQRNGSEYYLFAMRPNTTEKVTTASSTASVQASLLPGDETSALEDTSLIASTTLTPASQTSEETASETSSATSSQSSKTAVSKASSAA